MNISLNVEEIKDLLKYIVNNNKLLADNNKKKTAIEVIGESGIGKTSSVIQLAEELGFNVVKLNVSQLDETGDILGFPVKEYELEYNKELSWVSNDILKSYLEAGYKATGRHRMGYAKPSWVPEDNENGSIIIFDDFNRAESRIITSLMELIDRGEFISWSLPKNCSVILTSNPDNLEYNVNQIDNAVRTRFISFNMQFDIDVWARWAEEEGIDNRGINFVLANREIFNPINGEYKVNARSMVTFFNTISGFKDFSNQKSLSLILDIAGACFPLEENHIGNLFTLFITNKLDKLIPPKDIVELPWSKLETELKRCVYDENKFRSDIASILSTRFLNYTDIIFKNKGKTDLIIDRLIEFIDSEIQYLSEDLLFNIIKNINKNYPTRSKKLIMNPKIMKIIS